MLLLAFMGVARADELTVNDGTATNGYVPLYGFYADAYLKAEYVIPADDLATMAGGTVDGMTFYATQSSVSLSSNFQVYLTEVDFTTLSDFNGVGNASLVYEGTIGVENGQMYIEFVEPYVYGGGNLLVAFYSTTTGNYSATTWYGETVNGASVQGYNYNGLDAVSPTQRNFLPKTTFSYEVASTCERPEGLMVTEVRPHQVTLAWGGGSGSFNVEFKKSTDAEWTRTYTGIGWGCVLVGLENNASYRARVQSDCGDGTASGWRTISFVTRDACPDAPTDLMVTEIRSHSASLTWNNGTGSFNVEYRKASDSDWTVAFSNVGWGCLVDGLDANTMYYVRVQSICDNGETSEWITSYFTTDVSCPAPADLTVVELTPTSVTLTWTPVGDETEWKLIRTSDNSYIDGITSPVYTVQSLTTNTVYSFAVVAVCGEGEESEMSNIVTIEPTNKLVIGSGTATNQYLPTYTYYNYSLTQQIYTAEEIGSEGMIMSVDFYNASTNVRTRSLDIYMVSTDKVAFVSNYDWITATEADLVFSGEVTFAAQSWTTIELDEAFAYNGESNLALIVDDNTGSWESAMSCLVFDAPNMAIRIYSDGTDYQPLAPSYSGTILNQKNQVRLDLVEGDLTFHTVSVTAEPENSGTVTGGGTFVDGRTVTITATPNYGFSFIKWTDLEGNIVTNEPSYTFVVNQDVDYVAHFEELPTYLVTLLAEPENALFYLYGSGYYYEGTTCTVEASSYSPLYYFIGWKDGNGFTVSNTPLYEFIVESDITLTAHFGTVATDLSVNPNPIDLGLRPNGAWMRPYTFTLTNNGFPAEIQSITTDNAYFTVETGNLSTPFTFDYDQTVNLGMAWGEGAGVINGNLLVTYASEDYTEEVSFEVTATAYTPVVGDVWENPIVVTSLPYTSDVYAANTPYYNNYVMPYSNIPDGYDVVYKLTFDQDTYLNAAVTAGENGKVALYAEGFKGLGGPDENNHYTNPLSNVNAAPFEAQIGEGTNTTGYFPFYTLYNYSIAENLYLADELVDAGVTTAPMTSLSWYATNAPGYFQQGISIWMANVNDTELTTTSQTVNNMTLVYTGAMTPEIGWNEFVFNEGTFSWDGSSNVLIFCQRNNGAWNTTVNWQASAVDFSAMSYRYHDVGAYDVTVPNTMNIGTTRPNIIMKGGNRVGERGVRDDMELTVHDGTATNGYVPVYGFYADAYLKCEMVYTSAELGEMAGGEISQMKFYATQSNVSWGNANFQVFLKEVGAAAISDYDGLTGASVVYEGPLSIVDGEMVVTFTTPYVYTGGNLLIGVYNTVTGSYVTSTWYGEIVNGSSVQGYSYSDLDAITATQRDFLPKTTFTYVAGNSTPDVCDFVVVPGTYYLVASSTSDDFTVHIEASEVPCPEELTLVAPEHQYIGANPYKTQLKWRLDNRATEYSLRFGTDPDNLETLVAWTDTLAQSYTVRNLNYSTAYYWQVLQRNDGCSEGVEGPVWMFVTEVDTPSNLYALNGNEIMEGDVLQLYWTAPQETTSQLLHYDVFQYSNETGETLNLGSTTDTHFEVEDLPYSNSNYMFYVCAVYDIGMPDFYSTATNMLFIYVNTMNGVEGHVYERDGVTGIANANVSVFGYDQFGFYHGYAFTTDEEGYFNGEMPLGYYNAMANAGGYQEAWYDGDITVTLEADATGIDFIMDEVFWPVQEVVAEYYPDANAYDGEAVQVSWTMNENGWHTYCEFEYYSSWRANFGTTNWAYYYPLDVLTYYTGTALTKVSLYCDEYGYTGGNYTCNIYKGGNLPQEGVLVSTLTVDVPQYVGDWVDFNLTEPIEITGREELWVVWTANTAPGSYPAPVCYGYTDNGSWANFGGIENGYNWLHHDYTWMMRQYFSDLAGRGTYHYANSNVKPAKFGTAADNAPVDNAANNGEIASCTQPIGAPVPLKPREHDRSLQYYRVYRTDYFNYGPYDLENTVLIADNVTETSVIDETFGELPMGTYKYGVSCVYEGNRESRISWMTEKFGCDETEVQKILNAIGNRNGDVVLLSESFDEGLPEGWTTIDADGDGHNWMSASELMNSNGMMCSESYSVSSGALNPDNYLVTPMVELGGIFTFYACAQDVEYGAEHFGVAVSTMYNNVPQYFNTIQEWTLTNRGEGAPAPVTRSGSRTMGTWYECTVDLRAYSGQMGYIAIRHFGCTDQFYLDIDNVTLYEEETLQVERESQITWSNPMDRDMWLYNVNVTVTLNDAQSPAGTTVTLSQSYEQAIMNLMPADELQITLDETGYYAWENFRKGEYSVTVNKDGYRTIIENVSIYDDTDLQYLLQEYIYNPTLPYVSHTGWAMWDDSDEVYLIEPTSFYADFEEDLSGWNVITVNANGGSWIHSSNNMGGYDYTTLAHGGTGFAMCYSYIDYDGAYNTDSYLVSPEKYAITATSHLTFWADNASDSYPENFSVCVATVDNPTPNEFITVWNGSAKEATGAKADNRHEDNRSNNWRSHYIDLSAFAGQAVYIAFHDVNYDMYEIWIDDVELTTDRQDGGRSFETYLVECWNIEGNEMLYSATTTDKYCQVPTDNLIEGETYIFKVASSYTLGTGDWKETAWVYQSCENFSGTLNGVQIEGTTISWEYLACGVIDTFSYDFDNGMPSDWTTIDADGDGYTWVSSMTPGNYHNSGVNLEGTGHNGSAHYVISGSYANGTGQVLYPDNYLVSPLVTIGNGSTFSFWACAQDVNYAAEHFGVAVSSTGTGDWTMVNEWTMSAKGEGAKTGFTRSGNRTQGNWYKYIVDLSAYSGQKYIAIRHFNCSDQFILNVDDIELNLDKVGAMVYLNGEMEAFVPYPSNEYTFEEEGEYCVRMVSNGQRDGMYYSMSCPECVIPVTDITQTTTFSAGWTWWSAYVEADDLLTQLETGLGSNGTVIKSQNDGTVSYLFGSWYGGLAGIRNENTYMVNANTATEVSVTGNPAQPADHPITLTPGWTWIGYPNSEALPTGTALSGHTPQQGDALKNQNATATYMFGSWYGSLSTLVPGMGLMYNSTRSSNVTFTYSSGSKEAAMVVAEAPTHWHSDAHAYPYNMNVLAVVELDGEELHEGHYEVAAFADGECRGSASMMYIEPIDRYMVLLTISGDEAADLRFSLYDKETGTEYYSSNVIGYQTDAIIGEAEAPQVLRFRGTTGMDELASSLQVYPNPVNKGETFRLDLPVETVGKVQVEIVNALGVVTSRATAVQVPATMKAPETSGVYTLRITLENGETILRKLIVR